MPPQLELTTLPESPTVLSAPAMQANVQWNSVMKIAFRFAFSYFGLYCFPFPIGVLPYTEKPAEWYELLWHKLVPWVAQHVLHLAQPITIFSNGSGDTTYDYVKVLCFVVLSAIATAAWSLLDRKRKSYTRLHEWLRFYIRLSLGTVLLTYGGYKVIPSQFPPLFQWRYLETYGDTSPMGILWTFMGASKAYTIFAGSVEMLGGILLFVPRLVTLGALIGVAAMTNVFILNMSYDVPVKLYSLHLLMLAVFLLLPELRRLGSFFIFNRATDPKPAELRFHRAGVNTSLLIGQIALVLFFSGYTLHTSHQQLKSFTSGDFAAKPPLYGAWGVDEFSLDGQVRPPLLTDEFRWQKIIFDFNTGLTIQGMDGKLLRFGAKMDTGKKTIELTKRSDPAWKALLTYQLPTQQTMVADGSAGAQKIHLTLHHLDGKYLLQDRGFHWINEFPFNR